MMLSKDCNKDWMWEEPRPQDEVFLANKMTKELLDKFDTLDLNKDFDKHTYINSDMYATRKLIPEIERMFSVHPAMWSGGEFAIHYESGYDEKDMRFKTFYLRCVYLLMKKHFHEYNENIIAVEIDYVNRWLKLRIKK